MDDKKFIETVLTHYKAHGRNDLPWRKAINPYKVLVSEIMLQQTQVARVAPKFAAWMKKYPTMTALSRSNLVDILKLWQGLGYQRRAKALWHIARTTSRLPRSYQGLIALPGVGPYTASAILAFAHNTFPEFLLETNIRTALIDAFHLVPHGGQGKSSIHDNSLHEDLSRLAQYEVVQRAGARTWYYALMDYGAYLKSSNISHNAKSARYATQSPYEGSLRQLRAKILFAITHGASLPKDERVNDVLELLVKEGYIVKKGKKYSIFQ